MAQEWNSHMIPPADDYYKNWIKKKLFKDLGKHPKAEARKDFNFEKEKKKNYKGEELGICGFLTREPSTTPTVTTQRFRGSRYQLSEYRARKVGGYLKRNSWQ